MNIRIAVVAEASRDVSVVRQLTVRIAKEVVAHESEPNVELVGPVHSSHGPIYLKWSNVSEELKRLKIRPMQGHFQGKKGNADATAAVNALRILRDWLSKEKRAADVVVLQRDLDKQPERHEGLRQGVHQVPLREVTVIIGAANPKVEAWAICALVPEDKAAHNRHQQVKKALGFDPVDKSHELDAATHGAKRDAKRVLDELIPDGEEQFAALEEHTAIQKLRERGQCNGLCELLTDLETQLTALHERAG